MDNIKYEEMLERFNDFITNLPEDVSDVTLSEAVELKGLFMELFGD